MSIRTHAGTFARKVEIEASNTLSSAREKVAKKGTPPQDEEE